MSAGAGGLRSLCLSCQLRTVGRPIAQTHHNTTKRRLETVALRPEDDGFLHHTTTKSSASTQLENSDSMVLPLDDTLRQVKLESPIDALRDALLGFQAQRDRRDLRLQVLRSLPSQAPPVKYKRLTPFTNPPEQTAPVSEAPIPHTAFRRNVKLAQVVGGKAIRQVMRDQLLRCEYPKEILRVMAVAMQKKVTAWHISQLHENIMRALYRCRTHISDPTVLVLLNTIIVRFKMANLPVDPQLLQMALKFAARARSLGGMKRYLRECRERNLPMSSNVFRSVIAKCSIGHRGLGEIRNGRWLRDQLMQVLTGFDDCAHLPLEQQYHLGAWLERDDWQYLHGWVAVLARCKASDEVWAEWQLWKLAEARLKPRALASMGKSMTSKIRGDHWFVEQMTYTGDLRRAWEILRDTGLAFGTLKPRVKESLVEALEHATVTHKDEDISNALLHKYDADLARIEASFGVKWEPGSQDGEGLHVLVRDQEEALEELSSENFGLDEDHGYPWETSSIIPQQDRVLHEARETDDAESSADRSDIDRSAQI